jgi:hypothetical protein
VPGTWYLALGTRYLAGTRYLEFSRTLDSRTLRKFQINQGPNKHVDFGSRKLFKMKMVVRIVLGIYECLYVYL